MLVVIGGGWWFFTTSRRRRIRDSVLLRMPVVGGVILSSSIARVTMMMSMMLRAGVPLTDALELVTQATENTVISRELGEVHAQVLAGALLSNAISSSPLFQSFMLCSILSASGVDSPS